MKELNECEEHVINDILALVYKHMYDHGMRLPILYLEGKGYTDNRVEYIKHYRDVYKLGLKDAKDLADMHHDWHHW